jgi:hypothetical protein
MSNCGVGSGGFELPGDVVAQHGVEGFDHLAHDGNDDDFGLFVGGGEATVEDFESRIVSASAQSGHVAVNQRPRQAHRRLYQRYRPKGDIRNAPFCTRTR